MPVPVHLRANRQDVPSTDGESLGARLRRRRFELGLKRAEAAEIIGADAKTLMWWERDERPPFVGAYPAIIDFLGFEPWPEPRTLREALLAERRRRGLEIRKAAALIGVDEGTWARWEREEWKPTRRTLPALDRLLGMGVASVFPSEVR